MVTTSALFNFWARVRDHREFALSPQAPKEPIDRVNLVMAARPIFT
jgi:hypothetical protein